MRDLRQDHQPARSQAGTRTKAKPDTAKSNSSAGKKTDTAGKKSDAPGPKTAARTTDKTTADKASASSLGRLNAAHASAQALANASPNSAVGQISAYKDALTDGDLEAAAEALAAVSNKTVTEASVKSLNELLGIEMEDAEVTDLVDKVGALEDKEPTEETTTTVVSTTTATPEETSKAKESMSRLNAAHASPRAMERASLNSPVGQIGAYKTAVAEGDLDAAATALAKASNKPVTADTVKNLNELLDATLTDDEITTLVEKTETLKAEQGTTPTSKKTSSTAR
jgi:hypothetical protein